MEEIIKQYAGPIIAVAAVVLIVAIVTFLLASDGAVATSFQNMLSGLMAKAGLGG